MIRLGPPRKPKIISPSQGQYPLSLLQSLFITEDEFTGFGEQNLDILGMGMSLPPPPWNL